MFFRNYRIWKSWLDHSLKSAVSEHALTVNMQKRPKYLRNLHESTFIRFLDHSQGKLIPKISLLVLGKALVVFVNTLSADAKYPSQDGEN